MRFNRTPGGSVARRGNSIVLVTALLVLLVIIATAYVTRTTAGRTTARAVRTAESRDANAQVIGEMLADFPAQALFVQPVNPQDVDAVNDNNPATPQPTIPANSNDPRLPAKATLSLYNTAASRYNVDFAYPYNFAPMHDVAFTNWPDALTLSLQPNEGGLGAAFLPSAWPAGPGNPSGGTFGALASEGNPIGNPGFGDNRWLADLEPIRLDLDVNGTLETFSHWRHMTNLSRPDNGWRVCLDIANVGNNTVMQNLTIPIEQWLAAPLPLTLFGPLGDAAYTGENNWIKWTASLKDYQDVLEQASLGNYSFIPGNFHRLRDLNADGSVHTWTIPVSGNDVRQETPAAEFDLGTARNTISRYLADTDGDGYTDAFWHLVPIPIKDGVRYVVAVRIIPNSAMIDVNTATRFLGVDNSNVLFGGSAGANSRTRGHGPADIGLVSQLGPSATTYNNLNCGFFDNPYNQYPAGADPFTYNNFSAWQRFVEYTNMPSFNAPPNHGSLNQYQRLDYYRRAGLNPLNANSISGYQPFTLADELELRMFHGQNYEWIFSRFEHSMQHLGDLGFVRANQGAPETSEITGQLRNRSLVADQRHRITMISSVRNELLAPWLRYRWAADTKNVFGAAVPGGDGIADYDSLPAEVQRDIDAQVVASGAASQGELEAIHRDISERFLLQNRQKLDLREPVMDPFGATMFPVTGVDTGPNIAVRPGWLSLRERLPLSLYHALDDGPRYDAGSLVGSTYFGDYSESVVSGGPGAVPETSQLYIARSGATSFAANILSYRSQSDLLFLSDDPLTPGVEGPLPLPAVPGLPAEDERQFLGVERQPFITEVFIGHVYEVLDVPDTDINGSPYLPPDERVVLHHPGRHSTVVVVQIANPFDKPIDLRQYKISVFGHTYSGMTSLPSALELQPATPETPNTAIFYAMKDRIGDTMTGATAFRDKWVDFLDIQSTDLTPNTIVRRVEGDWPVERDPYDNAPDDVDAVQLIRVVEDPPGSGMFVDVVVDRIDKGEGGEVDRAFSDAVRDLEDNKPPVQEYDPPEGYEVVPQGAPYQGYPNWHMELPHDHWVQWVRCTRAWGVNLDGSTDTTGRETYQHDERSPRFVFSDRAVITADESEMPAPYPTDSSYGLNGNGGNKYEFAKSPDDDLTGGTVPIPWFRRDYHSTVRDTTNPAAPTLRTGKPTFFDMKRDGMTLAQYQGNQFPYPDKGWYGQTDSGDALLDDDNTIGQPYASHNTNRNMSFASNGQWRVRHNFPMQMLQKDGDFEQIGEVLNVPIWGIELAMNCGGASCVYDHTTKTYAESMSDALKEASSVYGQRVRANRLGGGEETLGVGDPNAPADPLHFVPDQPAVARVLDLFVCDSYGSNSFDLNNDGMIQANETFEAEARRFSNANGFSGNPVYGMPNISVAPAEVLRALPHWSRLIYESPGRSSRSYLAEAVVQYRERFDGLPFGPNGESYAYRNLIDEDNNGVPESFNDGPDYSNRDVLLPNINSVRGDRGFASIGELLMLTQPGAATDAIDQNRWSVDFAGMNPFQRYNTAPVLDRATTRLSTDTGEDFRYWTSTNNAYWDRTAGDAEEMNMLFSGASNMITTRGDTFTIYFRIRAFKQNPVSGRWDATDPEYIVDDSRYVMCVDRSNVNSPGDKPKILFFEKCPN